jgi:dTDP-4-amino-4,6-dideoxygalactose transaminase
MMDHPTQIVSGNDIPFTDLVLRNGNLRRNIQKAIDDILESGEFSSGRHVENFEKSFAQYCGTKYAVAVSSGTDALWLALLSAEVGPGDQVITVPTTFIATIEAIIGTGAEPIFVDIDKKTYTMDPAKLEKAITEKTKAIVPVHLFGQMADMKALLAIAERHQIPVIEDASQAHGAEYMGKKAGSYGLSGCFSFYPTKNLGALGEAGAVTTNSRMIAEKIKQLRNHGRGSKDRHESIGWNCRMDEIQAAVLDIKLHELDKNNSLRKKLALSYADSFRGNDKITTPLERNDSMHSYHLYVILVDERNELLESLSRSRIEARIHYPCSIHLQHAYSYLGYQKGDFPIAEECANCFLSLPLHPTMNSKTQNRVINAVQSALNCETFQRNS